MEFQGVDPGYRIDEVDLEGAAEAIGCEVQAIKAVSAVEAPHGGFLADGRPTILFESHQFWKNTNGRFGEISGISSPQWVHDYGPGGGHQYDRLTRAAAIDRQAALKSASWGKYQIMGSNFADAGYDNVEAFVADMCESEAHQLDAFVVFVQNSGCDRFLIEKNWTGFALHYNGPGQVDAYAGRIAEAYATA
ncbi:MAG: N-acetylmuramidase family protein [Methylocella sp.]